MNLLPTIALAVLTSIQESDDPGAREELQSTGSLVAVESTAPDRSIEERLEAILRSIDQFESVELTVDNGVVVLHGVVDDQASRAWLSELASKTEGVTAVLNRLDVSEPALWDLRPAVVELETVWREFLSSLPRVGLGALFLGGFTLVAGLLSRVVSRPVTRKIQSELLRSVVRKLVVIGVWIAASYLFLRVSGLTQIAVTVVGGTGILGVVLGFAFRDIAENFLASVLISIQKPFRYGDTIEVDGNLGIVQRVTPRGTVLMDFDGNYIQIANAQVYKSTIKNFTANPNIRKKFVVGIGYDAVVSQAQSVVLEVLRAHEAVLEDPKPTVLVEELASATVNLHVYFWIDGTRHSPLKVRSALLRGVLSALLEAGVSLPDDAREVVFPSSVPVKMLEHDPDEPGAGTDGPSASDDGALEDEGRATEAEDGLDSEVEMLGEQARRSRAPEEGADILS